MVDSVDSPNGPFLAAPGPHVSVGFRPGGERSSPADRGEPAPGGLSAAIDGERSAGSSKQAGGVFAELGWSFFFSGKYPLVN